LYKATFTQVDIFLHVMPPYKVGIHHTLY